MARPTIERTCQTCHRTYQARKDGKGLFCSRACCAESKNIRIHRICKACSQPFEVMRKRVLRGTGYYCSRACADKFCRGSEKESVLIRFVRHVAFSSHGCWLWTGAVDSWGYGSLPSTTESKANRISFRLFRGEIPEGMLVLHTCDNPACVHPDHLFLGTHSDNMRDMAIKRRGTAKVTPEQVLAIRADPRPHHIIANDYPIGRTQVTRIKLGVRRFHIP